MENIKNKRYEHKSPMASLLVSSDDKFKSTREYLNKVMKGKKVNKILLINPPDVDEKIFDYKVAKRGRANNYPSYGIGVLAAQLRLLGYEINICNLNHEVLRRVYNSDSEKSFNFLNTWHEIISKEIESFKPDLIGVSCLFSVTHNSFKKVCKYLSIKYPDTPLLVGGVHVSHDIEGVMNDLEGVDFALIFESDRAFPNFLEILNGEKDISELAQFAYKKDNKIITFQNRLIPNTEVMNVRPAFDLMDIKNHSKFGTLGSWHGTLDASTVVSTCQSNRGCRAQCTFCNVRTYHGKTVRHKSVDSVVDELLCLQNDYGVEHIVWLDDDLLKDQQRTVEMFNQMVKRNVKLTWDATNGVIAHSLKSYEVVDAAHSSGCIGLHVGIESGNPNILKQIRKPGTVETFIAASEVLQKFPRINFRALLMLGFPNETLGMMFDTIELAEKINVDWANLSILQPWKGTPIYEEMASEGLVGMEEGTLKDDKKEKNAPYQLGTYSRQRQIEQGKIGQSHFGEKIGIDNGFLKKISAKSLDTILTRKELDDMWFYMNIRINFARLLRENRKEKIKQQYNWLNYVCNKTAPDNAMIIYFFALMQKKHLGYVAQDIITRLGERLKVPYWKERFNFFNLTLEQVKNENFPSHIVSGGIPNNYEGEMKKFYFPERKIN